MGEEGETPLHSLLQEGAFGKNVLVLWKKALTSPLKTNGLGRALFNQADNALVNFACISLFVVQLTTGIREEKAKDLQLKLIKATNTKCGGKAREFSIRTQVTTLECHWVL